MALIPGFNLEGEIESSSSLTDIDIGEKGMRDELRIKKKKKFNFDKLFPAPKHNENMGMDTIFDGEPFKGIL